MIKNLLIGMNDSIAGFTGGIAGLVLGHPLDTIKALIQTRGHTSIANTALIVFKNSQQLGFFRGLSLPFLAYGPMHSVIFVAYGTSINYLNKKSDADPPLKNFYYSGFITGFTTSFLKNPLEVVKIQLQTHDRNQIKSVNHCIRQLTKAYGFSSFFKGCSALTLRDSFSLALYFYTYEMLRRVAKNSDSSSNQNLINFGAGGLAGGVAWAQVMPLDVTKSRMQADINDKSFKEVVKLIHNESGLRGFYKGLVPTVLRGFLVNAVVLSTYSYVLEILNLQNPLF